MRRKVFAMVLSLILGLLMIPFLAHAEFYKWIDDKGGIHFTDEYSTIPEKYRQVAKTQWFPRESSLPSIKETPTPPLTPTSPESSAQETPTPALTPTSPESSAQETTCIFRGVISKVDNVAKIVVVTGDEGEMVFPVSQDTKIKSDNGHNIPFARIRSGMKVSVEYIKKGNDNYARSITVSILLAGTTNAAESNQGGPGQLQNPGEIQKGVWQKQKAHKLHKK